MCIMFCWLGCVHIHRIRILMNLPHNSHCPSFLWTSPRCCLNSLCLVSALYSHFFCLLFRLYIIRVNPFSLLLCPHPVRSLSYPVVIFAFRAFYFYFHHQSFILYEVSRGISTAFPQPHNLHEPEESLPCFSPLH